MRMHYCKKCGRVVLNSEDVDPHYCDYCQSVTYPVPEKYMYEGHSSIILNEQEQLLREELVRTSPEFDEYLYSHRDSDLAARRAQLEGQLAYGKAVLEGRDRGNRFGIECPYCHATNIRKISFLGRAVSAGLFGLGSNKIGKQWHCDRCGSDF